ncbi:envelope stress sensor histidine kinase CpxA [Marinomonas sp. C1424]|uniref:histidine kinase n=1 Tax=Marinomonas transparens TaxID=2795388 RepID=A0A934JXZ2_9GAMM|nr:envelope stress sensor histidine kinase CpxA [Marinomonas transparens]
MKLPKITNLYGRIFAVFWLTMLLVLLAVMALPHLDPRNTREVSTEHYQKIMVMKQQIERRFATQKDLDKILKRLVRPSRAMPHGDRLSEPSSNKPRFFITDLDGNILTPSTGRDYAHKAVRNFVSNVEDPHQPLQRLYGRFILAGPFPIHLANADYLLYVGMKSNELPPFFLQLLDHPIQLLLLVMLVSTPLLLRLSWVLSQPARLLEKAAQRVARGEFEIDPMLERGTSEFRQAGASFNQMVEAVNQMMSRQQRLLSDISHELRSPLTRLRMAQALATRKQGESQELARIDTEAQRLELMIAHLLELSRMQVDSHQKREIQSLTSLWETLLEDTQFEAEQMGKSLVFTSIPERHIACHPQLLISALENIIRNAIYYGKDKACVTMTAEADQLHIQVEDNGEGVAEEELTSIFRPFYRVSTARDRNSGGTGLGLAITENAIRQHNGRIHAVRSPLGGLLVEIHLPLVAL